MATAIKELIAPEIAGDPMSNQKWNPIEHQLFSYISITWAGKPLRSFETMLTYIRGTTTETGLVVEAQLIEREYEKGLTVCQEEMEALHLKRHNTCPHWNYTIKPRCLASDNEPGEAGNLGENRSR